MKLGSRSHWFPRNPQGDYPVPLGRSQNLLWKCERKSQDLPSDHEVSRDLKVQLYWSLAVLPYVLADPETDQHVASNFDHVLPHHMSLDPLLQTRGLAPSLDRPRSFVPIQVDQSGKSGPWNVHHDASSVPIVCRIHIFAQTVLTNPT